MTQDWSRLVAELERLLKLRAIPFGMKLFERREDMAAIPRIRRPAVVHTLDQIVAQAARLLYQRMADFFSSRLLRSSSRHQMLSGSTFPTVFNMSTRACNLTSGFSSKESPRKLSLKTMGAEWTSRT